MGIEHQAGIRLRLSTWANQLRTQRDFCGSR
jgi:hypothetical protein